jgi:hypothetical protein
MSWLSLLLLIVPLALGCGGKILTQWPQKQIFTEYFRQQEVKMGMSRQEVEAIMGPPQMQEEGDFKGGHFLLYFYRTHNMDYPESDTIRGAGPISRPWTGPPGRRRLLLRSMHPLGPSISSVTGEVRPATDHPARPG